MAENSKIEWRDIPGFEGQYQVSNHGQIRRLQHIVYRSDGMPKNYKAMNLSLSGKRYLFVRLRRKKYYVHRIVMLAFVGPCPKGKEVNHRDANKKNNFLENLEYVTRSQNNFHAGEVTGCRRGSKQWMSKLTEQEVMMIKIALRHGEKQKSLAKEYGVTQSNISAIKCGRSWGHLGA